MLATVSTGNFIALVFSSAAIAAIISGLFSWRQGRANRAFQQALRAEDAETATRDRFLPLATKANDWLWYDFGNTHGMDFDYHGSNAPTPELRGISDVIGSLNVIALQHPNEMIRDRAKHLKDQLDDHYNMIPPGGEGYDPSDQEMRGWCNEARDLVASIRDGTAE